MRTLTSTKELTNAGILFVTYRRSTCKSYIARIDCYSSKENRIYHRRIASNGAGGKLEVNTPEGLGMLPHASGVWHDTWMTVLISNTEMAAIQKILKEYCDTNNHHLLQAALKDAGYLPAELQ